MKKKTKLRIITILICLITFGLTFMAYLHVTKPEIVFKKDEQTIEIASTYDLKSFIEEVKNGSNEDVTIKDTIKADKLGTYKIDYHLKDKTFTLTCKVVDTKKPEVVANELTIKVNDKPEAKAFIKNVKDATSVTYAFKEDYRFDTVKDIDVTIIVSDEAKNKTEVKTIAHVRKEAVLPKDQKIIYLTIDDGPSANTPKILAILKRYNVKATFFVTAQSPAHFQYIKQAYDQGHAIGLHTFSHDYAEVYASEAAYFQDLAKISDVVKQQTGIVSNIIRFPGGSSNTISANYTTGIMSSLSKTVLSKGYQYYDWNASSGDGNSSLGANALIKEATSTGDMTPLMMLTHDHAGSNASVEAMPSIIEYYQRLGYTFEVVDSSIPGFHHGLNN